VVQAMSSTYTQRHPPHTGTPSREESLATYERLAPEYAGPAHATTRALERLSIEAYRHAQPLARAARDRPDVLELGAGAGALTALLLPEQARGRLLVTDPAPGMLARLRPLLVEHERVDLRQATADVALQEGGGDADVVIAGLADPFLTPELLRTALARLHQDSVLFVTVPSRSWALAEREGRLHIPLESTRFRLLDGTELRATSWTYDEDELEKLCADCGFLPIEAGTCTDDSPAGGEEPAAEVAWVLAKPRVAGV
jgi:SAM-dependent methyltransferase